jgi:hypothetical protein
VGEARIAELETAGQAAIEVRSVQIQRELVAGGLRSDEAKCLLASLPSADELMPDLSLEELEQAVPLPQPHGRGGGDSGAPAAEGTGGPARNTSASSSCAERAGLPRLSCTWGHSTSWP